MSESILVRFKNKLWVDLALVFLALLSVGLLVFELSEDLLPEQIALIHKLDVAIALIFLSDFILGISFSKNKKIILKKTGPTYLPQSP